MTHTLLAAVLVAYKAYSSGLDARRGLGLVLDYDWDDIEKKRKKIFSQT
jgi:hypothetical protein